MPDPYDRGLMATAGPLPSDIQPVENETRDRIITGLARQLRSPLDRDPARGRYAVTIGVLERSVR